MKKTSLAILGIAVCFAAFAQKTKVKKKVTKDTGIVSVSVRRTGCFGHCPDYSIMINKSGVVTYTGNRFTPDTGIFTKNIGKARAAEVLAQFTAYQVDTCQELYENRIPDLPGLNYNIQYGDRNKKIFCANWGPHFLKELADTMDATGNKTTKKGWKKVGMPPKAW